MSDLLKRWHPLLPTGLGYPGLFGRQVEIFGVGVRNSGFVPRLTGQPNEEPFQGVQGSVKRCLAQRLVSLKAHSLREVRLESLRLFNMECLEVSEFRIRLEAIQSLRHGVER